MGRLPSASVAGRPYPAESARCWEHPVHVQPPRMHFDVIAQETQPAGVAPSPNGARLRHDSEGTRCSTLGWQPAQDVESCAISGSPVPHLVPPRAGCGSARQLPHGRSQGPAVGELPDLYIPATRVVRALEQLITLYGPVRSFAQKSTSSPLASLVNRERTP